MGPDESTAEEIPRDRRLEAGEHEADEVDIEGEKVPQEANEGQTISQVLEPPEGPMAGTSTPPAMINNPPCPSFFEVGHLLASFAAQASPAPRRYTQCQPKRSLTPQTLTEISDPSQLTFDTHPFLETCNLCHLS